MSKILLFIWILFLLLSSTLALDVASTGHPACLSHVNFDIFIIPLLLNIICIILIIKFYSKFKRYSTLSKVIIMVIFIALLHFSFQMTYDAWCGSQVVKYQYNFTTIPYIIEYNFKLLQ